MKLNSLKQKPSFAIITLCLLLSTLFSACAPKAEPTAAPTAAQEAKATEAKPQASTEKVTLRFAYNWTGGDSKAAYYEAAIAKYQAEHPNVEIVLEGTPGMEHQNKIKVDLAGGNLPDVFMYWTGGSFIQPLADAGVILDMAEFFKASQATKQDQWNESAYESAIYNGKIYMLPVESFKGFMIANKTLFDQYGLKYPTTMAELVEVSKVFVENGIVPINMASKGGNPGHLFYNAILYQMQDGISDANAVPTSFTVSTPSMLAAANIVNEMVTAQMFPADTIANGDWGPAVALYNERQAAMIYCFPWKIGDIKAELLPETEVIEFPKMDGAAIDPTTFNIGGVSMGVAVAKASFDDSAKQSAIVDFVDFLVSDEMFTELGKASMMPAKMVTLDPASLNPLFVQAVDFTGKKATYQVLWNFFTGASQTAYADAMDELFAGAAVADVIAKLQAALDESKVTTPGSAQTPAEKVTLRFAYNWTGGDAKAAYYEAAIAKYQAEHPNVEIVLEGTPGMEHQNKIKVDLAGDNLPDLFMYWTGAATLEPLLDADALLDMEEFFKVSQATQRDQWNESTFSTSIVNGKTYMLPVESFKGFMIANKTMFDQYGLEYPTTMAELQEVSKVFVENGIVPILMASKGGNPGHLFYNELVYQMPNGLKDAQALDTSFKLTEPFLKAAEIVNEMSAAQMFPADTIANGDWGPAVALYNEQKAAMVYCFPWKIGDIQPEIIAETEVIHFPKMDGAEVDATTFSIGGVSMGLSINKASFNDSAKQAAIVEFADFLVSDAMFTELGKASMMPAKKVTLDPASLNPLFVAAVNFTSAQETYDVLWSHMTGAASQTAYGDVMDELFAGTPAAEAIAKLQAALDQDKK